MSADELGVLLWQLVRGDLAARHVAAQTLAPLKFEALEAGGGGWREAWAASIRAAITAPDFATREWVLALMETIETGQRERMAASREVRQLEVAQSALLEAQIKRAVGKRESKKLAKQWRESLRFGAPKSALLTELERTADQWLDVQVEAGLAYRHLGDVVLIAEDKLKQWLVTDSQHQHKAVDAVRELGAQGARFAPALLHRLDHAKMFQSHLALAEIARDDAQIVRALVKRAIGENPNVDVETEIASTEIASRAIHVLKHIGPPVARVCPDAIAMLLRALDKPETQIAAINALGTIGRGDAQYEGAIVARLVELSRTDDMWRKGAAISALGDLGARADVVVPRLIEAFDDYDEPDPDYLYESAHGFVTTALAQFGPRAAQAVPALLARVEREGEGLDRGVLEALSAIGAAALPWRGAIEALAHEWRDETLDREDNEFDVILDAMTAGAS